MGVYLSKANVDLEYEEGSNERMNYCVGEIQGWRRNMEDAHIAAFDLTSIAKSELGRVPNDEEMSIFGVFDGHGGKEVAKFVQIKFIREFLRTRAFSEDNYTEALRTAFHRIDDMLEDEKYNRVLNKLKDLPNPSDQASPLSDSDDDEEDSDDDIGRVAVKPKQSKKEYKKFDPIDPEYASDDDDSNTGKTSASSSDDTIKALVDKSVNKDPSGTAKKKLTKAQAIELFTELILKETGKRGIADSQDDSDVGIKDLNEKEGNDETSIDHIDKNEWEKYYKNPSHIPGDGVRPTLQKGPASIKDSNGNQCNLREHRVQAGCTSVVVLRVGNVLYTANAGDSRAVLCRGDGKVHALSEDHKPSQLVEMARIEKAGGFININGRINGNLNLSRSIGDMKYKQVDGLLPSEQMITAEPDITVTNILPSDNFFVIACDGVWDVLSNQEMCDFVSERMYPTGKPLQFATSGATKAFSSGSTMRMSNKAIIEDIFKHCVADDPKKTQGIGGDNMTAMIVELK